MKEGISGYRRVQTKLDKSEAAMDDPKVVGKLRKRFLNQGVDPVIEDVISLVRGTTGGEVLDVPPAAAAPSEVGYGTAAASMNLDAMMGAVIGGGEAKHREED